ncbi:related to HRD1 - involved in degradation of Hmg2p [Cephalotrichum gorgonifer]|uniref:RING-type E3 ubiquitin transferase n=1 Tax=Cephalotrichum gorgonifer TaxID=2041049 RepID=A0AAE8SS01_9PEZI|nr:related to HRD1 - involved in degradation of Hmg2p [Cephalotrichum gorgonifer]
MRLAWYAGASAALAVSVVLSAFHQRANFYSAMVYLSESNFCLLALVNFVYIIYGAFMYGLQRLCFGQLRAVEVDQLSDRAWVAITETCLAMTIFREEIGAWFLVMFTLLVTGKVWGWIGDGRLEVLEQQPPANPRLFHGRLVVSLLMSTIYDIWLLRYSINTVVQQARPNMMVMFLFEFAVLTTSSLRTNARYILTLADAKIVATQTSKRLAERRAEVRQQREEILRQREADLAAGREPEVPDQDLPNPDDVDELDIEVPGWEAKGQWVLTLELIVDFIKLSIYMAFFTVLLMFYGLPVHIMRDVYITASAFFKRLSALLKYRRAIQSMNKFSDATAEDLTREDTCIICREEMRPWDPASNPGAVERTRPKKLPCGHILHLGCLKSWLERQQVCPTCRNPVLAEGTSPGQNNQNRPANLPGQGQQQPQHGQGQAQAQAPPHPQGPNGQAPVQHNNGPGPNDGGAPAAQPGHRAFNLGPFRLEFIRGDFRNHDVLDDVLNRGMGGVGGGAAGGAATHANGTQPGPASMSRVLSPEFNQLVNRELASLQSLQNMQHELQTAHLLVAELTRLRQLHQQMEQLHGYLPAHGQHPSTRPTTPSAQTPTTQQHMPVHAAELTRLRHLHQPMEQHPTTRPTTPSAQMPLPGQLPLPGQVPRVQTPPPHTISQYAPFSSFPTYPYRGNSLTRYAAPPNTTAIPSGSTELPDGVVLPPGWSLLPLNRMDTNPATAGTPPPQPTETSPTVMARRGASSSQEQGAASASTGERERRTEEETPVLAPNPVLPVWGGSSQLFSQGLSGSHTPDVVQPPSPPKRREEGEGDGEGSGENGSGSERPEEEGKGKGKAVTLEEADEEEE